jgi:hypothetical protein
MFNEEFISDLTKSIVKQLKESSYDKGIINKCKEQK